MEVRAEVVRDVEFAKPGSSLVIEEQKCRLLALKSWVFWDECLKPNHVLNLVGWLVPPFIFAVKR